MLFQEGEVKTYMDRLGNLLNKKIQKMRHLTNSIRRRFGSLSTCCLLFPPIDSKAFPGKVSLCASFRYVKKASLAVETALVLPLFFLGMITLISFMDIYQLQTEHLSKLSKNAQEAGMYAYAVGGEGPEEITLPDVYAYNPIGGLVPLPRVWMHNTVKVHAWTGSEYGSFQNEDGENESEPMVYVTESGSVCHKSLSCTYLDLSVTQVSGSDVSSMRNQNGEKYCACETCSRGQSPAGSVYITQNGNRYHNLESCSGLKRTVRMVKASQVSEMCSCSRCG